MNILIIGSGATEQKLIELCLKSRFLDHLYTASNTPLNDIPNVEYTSFQDLCYKAKALQVDIILVANKQLIKDGIVEVFRKNRLNIISVNKKWFNLESSRLAAKQLMNHYSINNPEVILAPLAFPIVLKTNEPKVTKIIRSMQELIKNRENLSGESVFLEEFLNGETLYLLSLWDGKNLTSFSPTSQFTEVQEDRLNLFKTKLGFMFSDEKANFIGFFTTKLIWAKNDWHVLEYIMHFNQNTPFESINKDFLYIINSAIYQKLNEISY